MLSHFIAWYALGTGVLALVLTLLGSRRWAIAAILLTLLQAAQPLSWYIAGRDSVTEDGVSCRILLANVLSSNTNTQAFLDLVEEMDPDIICAQEVDSSWAEALETLRDSYPMHHVIARSDNFGIAIYSRVSPSPPETVFQDVFGVPTMTVPIEIEGVTASLLSLHTLPPMRTDYANTRNAQLGAARAWYERQQNPAIIVGDLNLTMYSPIYRGWLSSLDIKNARAGHGPLGSWPDFVPFLRLPLDQCLVSPAIGVSNCELGPKIGSDHLPLIIDLRLPR